MEMRASCHHEVCGTCSQEEGSLQKLPTSFLPEIGVFVRTSLVQKNRCDQSPFWSCVNGALIPCLVEEK